MSKLFRSSGRQRLQQQPKPKEPLSPTCERDESIDLCPRNRWKGTLKANHQNLRSEIRIKDVLAAFHGFLNPVEYLRVKGSEKVDNVDQVDALVEILLTKEKRHFEAFLVTLWEQGYADTAARLAEEAGVVFDSPSGVTTAVDRDVLLATRAGIPKSLKDNAMKEKKMLYYPDIELLHNAFYSGVIIPFEAFVMKSTDVDFQLIKRVCEQVIRRNDHPIACKVHLPSQRSQFLDDLQHRYGLWKDFLEYQLLHEVIMEFQDEGLKQQLKQYEILLREKGNVVLMQCQREFRSCPDLCLELKADHNTALSTLRRLKTFLIEKIGLKDASFAGFREGCIELFFQISEESASTAFDPLCSREFRSMLLSMGVRRVTLSRHWMINTETGHVTFWKGSQNLVEEHDAATDDDSIADERTQFSEVTVSVATNSGIPLHLEEIPPPCKRVKVNPEEEEDLVIHSSPRRKWETAQDNPNFKQVFLPNVLPSLVADSGTLADEDTKEDKMSNLIEVTATTNFGLRTDLKEATNIPDALPTKEEGPTMYLGNLRLKHRKELALLLNLRTTLDTDWMTLADHLGFSARAIKEIERRGEHDSPTLLLLQDLESWHPHYTVNDLVRRLTEMDRPDAVMILQEAQDEYFQSYLLSNPSEALPLAYSSLSQSPPDQAVMRGEGGFRSSPFTTEGHPFQYVASTQSFVKVDKFAACDFNILPTLEPSSPDRNDDDCLSQRRKQALRNNRQGLRSGLIVENILPAFRPHLTDIEYLRVESQTGNVPQVDELVKILLTKEDRHFDEFCRVCERNGYRHWAQKLKADTGVGQQEEEVFNARDLMDERDCFYYVDIQELHDEFYGVLLKSVDTFVLKSSDESFQRFRREAERVVRRSRHVQASKARFSHVRIEFLDEIQDKYALWDSNLEYRLLREVIIGCGNEDLMKQLQEYENLLRAKGETIIYHCKKEQQRNIDLYIKLKAKHETTLATLMRMQDFLVNEVGLDDAIFTGFREGCIELYFKLSPETASISMGPLRSNASRLKLLSLGVSKVELSGHWVIDTNSGRVTHLKDPRIDYLSKDTASSVSADEAIVQDQDDSTCKQLLAPELQLHAAQSTGSAVGSAAHRRRRRKSPPSGIMLFGRTLQPFSEGESTDEAMAYMDLPSSIQEENGLLHGATSNFSTRSEVADSSAACVTCNPYKGDEQLQCNDLEPDFNLLEEPLAISGNHVSPDQVERVNQEDELLSLEREEDEAPSKVCIQHLDAARFNNFQGDSDSQSDSESPCS